MTSRLPALQPHRGSDNQREAVDRFSHPKLDVSSRRKSIRLLRIVGDPDDLNIRCEMWSDTLDSETAYEALSYRWGDSPSRNRILINDMAYDIRDNLFDFLWQARQSRHNAVLWIDALCIDQSNREERNHQVAFMSDIYSRASRTIVWLGDDNNRTKTDVRYFFKLCDTARPDKLGDRETRLWNSAWEHLAANEYWSRLWIIQEVLRSRVVMLWHGIHRLHLGRLCLFLQSAITEGERVLRHSPLIIQQNTIATRLLCMRIKYERAQETRRFHVSLKFGFEELIDLASESVCLNVWMSFTASSDYYHPTI
jgi:hypothetical protein